MQSANPTAKPDRSTGSSTFPLIQGSSPVLVSIPHCERQLPGERVPDDIERALPVEDRGWYLERLRAFAAERGASLLPPRFSRHFIDLIPPREDTPMYPGRNTTGLCLLTFFTSEPSYRPGPEPDAPERASRIEPDWEPYHQALGDKPNHLRARPEEGVHSIQLDTLLWPCTDESPIAWNAACAARAAPFLERGMNTLMRWRPD